MVIRSHGVTPQVLAAVEDRGFTVVDATCPHVSRAQHAAAELAAEGCRVIVVGEAGHPEVEGLRAWAEEAGGKVDVVAAPEEIPEGLYDPVGVVAQTTQRRENLEAVVAALREAGLEPIVKNTICSATRQRQEAAADLASAVDAMVVIGGRNSSNTTRLAEVCALTCPRTFHIESTDELDPEAFADCRRVGVTAARAPPRTRSPPWKRFCARCSHGNLSRKRHRARGLLCLLRRLWPDDPRAGRGGGRGVGGAGGAYRRRGAGEPRR